VIGCDGRPLTRADLPARDARWNRKRKAQVVAAVRGNLLSFDEAMRRYRLSPGEFRAWESEVFAALAERRRATERREFRLLRREATLFDWQRARAG
jgi:hypothetical protein